jgi:hypothetical protein
VTGRFNGKTRVHFDPLYDEHAAFFECDVLVGNQVALKKILCFSEQHPSEAVKIVFVVSRSFIPGPPKRVIYENIDHVIQDLFVEKLRRCWQVSFDSADSPSLPPEADRERMLQCMKVALRDSVLNDLYSEENLDNSDTRNVLRCLLRYGDDPHVHGPLKSHVVLKSDTFSHFAYCDENCESVQALVPVHFRWPELVQVFCDLANHMEAPDAAVVTERLQHQIIQDLLVGLRAKGFPVDVAFHSNSEFFCTLKLIFRVRRDPSDSACISKSVEALSAAIEEVLHSNEKFDRIDAAEVCIAKNSRCPSCHILSDSNSMFFYRNQSSNPQLKEILGEYNDIFERASRVLPKPSSSLPPVCKGLDRGSADVNWLKRIPKDKLGAQHEPKTACLSEFQEGDVLINWAQTSYSSDMGSTLNRYASPGRGFSKATVLMINHPSMCSRYIDPISIIRFLSKTVSESEYHIEKDAELRLVEIKRGCRGVRCGDDTQNCDTFVFDLVPNVNKLSPSGIASLELPGIRTKRAHRLLSHATRPRFRSPAEFISAVASFGLGSTRTAKLLEHLERRVANGELSFRCESAAQGFVTPRKESQDRPSTPPTVLKLTTHENRCVLQPLLRSPFSASRQSTKVWAGGLVPLGYCHDDDCKGHALVHSFRLLVLTEFHDGSQFHSICSDASIEKLLLEEADIIDDFMEDNPRNFLVDASIVKTYVTPEQTLVIRSGFLELCRRVVGLDLPAGSTTRCWHCGKQFKPFTQDMVPDMRHSCYIVGIKSANHRDVEYDPQCDSE